jgi:hypothetical protein
MPRHAPQRPSVIGLAWYDRKQWRLLTEVAQDRREFEATYEQWERSARETVRTIEGRGQTPEKVHVEVESLVSWCKEQGLPVNAESCAEYVSQLIRRRHGRNNTR